MPVLQRPGMCAGSDDDLTGRERIVADHHPVRADKAGRFVVSIDPCLPETLLLPSGGGTGERAHKGDESRPVDRDGSADPVPLLIMNACNHLGSPGEHLLWDTTPESARPPILPPVGDRHPHTGISAVPGDIRTGDPGPDDDDIVCRLILHPSLSSR